MNLWGRTAAGPTHPKPAGPRSCGAAQLRGHANPKCHTLLRSPGSRTATGPTHLNRRGRAAAGPIPMSEVHEAAGPQKNSEEMPLYRVPGACTLNPQGRAARGLRIKDPMNLPTPPFPGHPGPPRYPLSPPKRVWKTWENKPCHFRLPKGNDMVYFPTFYEAERHFSGIPKDPPDPPPGPPQDTQTTCDVWM